MAADKGKAQGRVVLVTGGMGGLGETIATKMVDAGYQASSSPIRRATPSTGMGRAA